MLRNEIGSLVSQVYARPIAQSHMTLLMCKEEFIHTMCSISHYSH